MSLEYKIPRFLWENFESVLLAQSKRYVCELAKKLGVPEKELLKKVLPSSDSVTVLIQDTSIELNQCRAYIQNDKLTVFCRKPTAYACEYCAFHRNKRMNVIEDTNPHEIQKIKDKPNYQQMWLNKNTIVSSNGNIIGKVNKTKGLVRLFVVSS